MKPLNFISPTLALIAIALGFFLWGQCSRNQVLKLQAEAQESQHQQEIAKLDAVTKTAGHRADSLEASFKRRHLSDSVALSGLRIKNKGMSENVHILREPVQPLIDSIQALARFVRAYDSLLAGKDEEIRELELRHSAQIIDLQSALKERGNQLMAEAQKTELWRQAASDAQHDAKVERRKKGVWRTTAAILAGGVLFLTIQK
jgi:hypothetical protein